MIAGQGSLPKAEKKRYYYNPHLAPALRFDSPGKADQVAVLLEKARHEPRQEAVKFYQHDIDWTNRLMLGDSLLMMSPPPWDQAESPPGEISYHGHAGKANTITVRRSDATPNDSLGSFYSFNQLPFLPGVR